MAKNLRWYRRNFLWRKLRVNRKYKDRLFRFLFQNKKDLLQLYNAVSGNNYENPEELEIITLEDVIFMHMKNDLSFMIANRMNLYEHQSTYSPNMPIRGLIYFARQYEGLIAERKDNVYGSKLVKLPTPEYVVFYNGTKEQKDRTELFLSDAFETGRDTGCLECKAVMLNINRGHNKELMEKCRRLWEYSEFIAEVNDNLSKGDAMKKAVTKAMESCAQRGVLEDVINKNRGEVLHMLLTEYDEEQHMKATFKEGRDDLLEEQIRKKLKRGMAVETIAKELEQEVDVIREIAEDIINKNRGEVLHMLLTEYDEEQHMKATFKEGYEDGYGDGYGEGEQSGYSKGTRAGRDALLAEKIQKKLKRGKSIEQIAEELEEEVEVIKEIVKKLS